MSLLGFFEPSWEMAALMYTWIDIRVVTNQYTFLHIIDTSTAEFVETGLYILNISDSYIFIFKLYVKVFFF